MKPSIYDYTNYVLFLKDVVAYLKMRRVSLRSIGAKSGFKSGNYIQLIVQGKRNLTERSARRLSLALEHSKEEQEYFVLLVRLTEEGDSQVQWALLEEMKKYLALGKGRQKVDVAMSSHWFYGVIYELAGSDSVPLTPETIQKRLTVPTSIGDIADGLQFLIKKGYLIPTKRTHFYDKAIVSFLGNDDVRHIEVQQNHLRYLDFAKHRLNDDVKQREFQGLTIGISKDSFGLIRDRMRSFNDEIDRILSSEKNVEAVVRIQMAAFYVAR